MTNTRLAWILWCLLWAAIWTFLALFTFGATLVCTVGSLLLILVPVGAPPIVAVPLYAPPNGHRLYR